MNIIKPEWPAPAHVKAYSTTRLGGVSQAPFDSFNLGMRGNDNPEAVQHNRQRLIQQLQLPSEPCWIQQTHSNIAIAAQSTIVEADASFTSQPHQVCIVLTADCLPILLCDKKGSWVAAIHAGWRGLARGIIQASLQHSPCDPDTILAWLGPTLCVPHFEVGAEVRAQFCDTDAALAQYFSPSHHAGHWLANISGIATQILEKHGISAIYDVRACTYCNATRFYSYRREGETGRMASLIWLAEHA